MNLVLRLVSVCIKFPEKCNQNVIVTIKKRSDFWSNLLIFSVGMTGFEPATTRPPDVYSTGLSYIPSFFELRCKGTYLWGFCKFSSSFFVLIMSFFLLICVTCCFVVDYQLL